MATPSQTILLPFRQYDEHDVINLFAWSGVVPAYAGWAVTPIASGWRTDETDTQLLGAVGTAVTNTQSLRYGTLPSVSGCGSGDMCIGILLNDVRELDENGEKLVFKPRKLAEMQCVLSGTTVPILTRGLVLYSGTVNGGPVTAGAIAFASGNGNLSINSVSIQFPQSIVGRFIGGANGNGHALLMVKI